MERLGFIVAATTVLCINIVVWVIIYWTLIDTESPLVIRGISTEKSYIARPGEKVKLAIDAYRLRLCNGWVDGWIIGDATYLVPPHALPKVDNINQPIYVTFNVPQEIEAGDYLYRSIRHYRCNPIVDNVVTIPDIPFTVELPSLLP